MRIETGSSLQTFMTCPRLYKYKYIDRLSSPMYSSALAYGTFVHAFVERYNGDRPNEPGRAFERELKEYGEQNEQRIRIDFDQAEKVVNLWRTYWDGFTGSTMSTPALKFLETEQEWAFDIRPGHTKAGKRDGYVELLKYGKRALYELKTSGDTSRDAYKHKLSLDKQINANIMALLEEKKECEAVLYDIIWKPALRLKTGRKTMPDETQAELSERIIAEYETNPSEYFERLLVYRSKRDLEEYVLDTKAQFDTLDGVNERGLWYRNTGACEHFGKLCQFFSVCMDDNAEDREQFMPRAKKHPELSHNFQLKLTEEHHE